MGEANFRVEVTNYTLPGRVGVEPVRVKDTLDPSKVSYPCSIYFDQAVHTGLAIFDSKGRLIETQYIEKLKGVDTLEFRLSFRDYVEELIDEYEISTLVCEDVFGGVNFTTTEVLISLRDALLEAAYNKGIKGYAVNNARWKSRLSYPATWDRSVDEKEQIRIYVEKYFPGIDFKEDVVDAVGMGIAVLYKTGDGLRPLDVQYDKNLPIDYEVYVVDRDKVKTEDDIRDYLSGGRFGNRLADGSDLYVLEYNKDKKLEENLRLVLTNLDAVVFSEIPEHRYLGQIMMLNSIIPKELGDNDILVVVGRRK